MKFKIVLVSLLGPILCPFVASAERDSDCFPARRYDEIRREFTFTLEADNQALGYRHCDLDSPVYRVVKALIQIKDLPALESRPSEFLPGFIRERYYDYIKRHAQNFVIHSDELDPGCSNRASGFVRLSDPRSIHICRRVVEQPNLRVSAILIHEVRHLELRESARHVFCGERTLKFRQVACDERYEGGGGYAAETEFFIRIARSQRVAESVRILAKRYAISNLFSHFNIYSFGIRPGAVLVTDSEILFFDGTNTDKIMNLDPGFTVSETWLTYQNTPTLTFVYKPTGDFSNYGYDDNSRFLFSNFWETTYLKSLTASERSQFIDVVSEYPDSRSQWDPPRHSCFLFRNFIRCGTNHLDRNGLRSVALNRIRPLNFARSRYFTNGFPTIVGEDFGRYLVEQRSWIRSAEGGESAFTRFRGSEGVLASAQLRRGLSIGARADGRIQFFDENDFTWGEFPPSLRTKRVVKAFEYFLWSKKLTTL